MFKFDKEKATKMLGILFSAYRDETYLYKYINAKNGSAPQHSNIPKGVKVGSPEHILFLFFTTLLTYHSSSDVWFTQSKNMYEKMPGLFLGEAAVNNIDFVINELRRSGFIYPNEGGRRWYLCAKTLFYFHNNDPLKIFEENNINKLLLLKKKDKRYNFVGFNAKLFSLLALFYQELDLIGHIDDAYPIDSHAQNQFMGLGIVKINQNEIYTTKLAEFLRINVSNVCNENKFLQLDLAHATWFLGSRVCSQICGRKPNQTKMLCPVYDYCSGRISTKFYATEGKWKFHKTEELPLFAGV